MYSNFFFFSIKKSNLTKLKLGWICPDTIACARATQQGCDKRGGSSSCNSPDTGRNSKGRRKKISFKTVVLFIFFSHSFFAFSVFWSFSRSSGFLNFRSARFRLQTQLGSLVQIINLSSTLADVRSTPCNIFYIPIYVTGFFNISCWINRE